MILEAGHWMTREAGHRINISYCAETRSRVQPSQHHYSHRLSHFGWDTLWSTSVSPRKWNRVMWDGLHRVDLSTLCGCRSPTCLQRTFQSVQSQELPGGISVIAGVRTTRKTDVIWPDRWTGEYTRRFSFLRHSGQSNQRTCRTGSRLVCTHGTLRRFRRVRCE